MNKVKGIWGLIRETFKNWSEDKVPRLAAALSYYTIFSLAPLLVLVIAIASFVIGNNANIRDQVLGQVQHLVGQQGANIVNTMINNTNKPRAGIIATVIGIVTLILGATGVFGQLQDSLNTIWKVAPKENAGIKEMIKDRILSFAMILGLAFLLLVSFVISAALSVVNHFFISTLGSLGIISQIVNYAVSLAVVTLIFAAIFKVLPDVNVSWRDVWIGALVTAILFAVGQALISFYLSSAASTSAYGAAGSLVVILLYVYYSAQILFMGAEFTKVYAEHRGSVIEPTKNARWLTDGERAAQGIVSNKKPAPVGAGKRKQEPQPVSGGMGTAVPMMPIPVAGQPAIHPADQEPTVTRKERIRYTPPNPNTVIPVIGAGILAGAYTVSRVIRKIISEV